MRLLKADRRKRMPWKNGGGETMEIAVHPPQADVFDFEWRVSTASVAVDGPFSSFPGVDRTLCILDGDSMELEIQGIGRHRVTPSSKPLPFPADTPTAAYLPNGPILDLNVMTRRGRWRHDVRRVEFEGHAVLGLDAAAAIVLCCRNSVWLDLQPSRLELRLYDAFLFNKPLDRVLAFANAASALYVILLNEVRPARA